MTTTQTINNQTRAQVCDWVYFQIWNQVNAQVYAQAKAEAWPAVLGPQLSQFGDQVWDQTGNGSESNR
jgi:hypothetical protein